MYIPKAFAESDIGNMRALIRRHPLATLITQTQQGLSANHVPLLLQPARGEHGCLQGHIPRANPLGRDRVGETEVLAVFHGPAAYITPSWYPTKQEHGKVVPTWNYAVVHAYGRLDIIDDAGWIRAQVEALTRQNEAAFDSPWQVDDAPRDYTEQMIGALLGIEIRITRLLGKVEASQNQPAANRDGVIAGLSESEDPDSQRMAAMIAGEHKSRT